MEGQRFALKLLGFMVAAALLIFGVEFAYDISTAIDPTTGKPLELSSLKLTPAMIRAVASPFARAYNNILALILTFIGLAIPLTANLYTPKLIDIFVRDRVNLTVLCGYALLTAHSLLAATLSFDQYAGWIPFWVSFAGGVIGWTILLPYYFYVLSFLNPVRIIKLVEKNVLDEFKTLARSGESGAEAQMRLNQKILHLGSVLLKATDRADRDVAIDAVKAHVEVVKRFHDVKSKINPKFFEAHDDITVGMSRAAVQIMSKSQIWVEQKVMNQILLAYNSALGKMPDGVSSMADAVKDLTDHMAHVGDPEVLELLIRVMNTFMREAVKKKDVFSIYNVLYNYKSLTKKLMDDTPGKVPALARHIKYYADFSRTQGMPFIYELASYELAELAEYAYDHQVPQAKDLLETTLAFEGVSTSVRLVKSRMILAAYFHERGMKDELAKMRASISGVTAAVLAQAEKELLAPQDRVFWEVTDRGTNFDFVEDDRKVKIKELFDLMSAEAAAAAAAAGAKQPAAAGAKA